MALEPHILITGATGKIGKQLVYELVRDGRRPVVHHRESSDTSYLDSLGLEKRTADLRIQPELNALMDGIDQVIHTAAFVDFRRDRFTQFTGINTFGAVNLYRAARRAGVKRFVHVSTVAAVGAVPRVADDSQKPKLVDESYSFNLGQLKIPYILSKQAAETELLKEAANGGPELVIVNPSIVLAPSRTGDDRAKAIRMFSRPVLPDYPNWLNLVDIRDIAPAIVAALDKGRHRQRYILAGDNITVRELLLNVSVILHKTPHLLSLPRGLVNVASRLSLWYSTVLRSQKISFYPDLVKLTDYDWVFSSMKARRELGFRPRSLYTSLENLLTNSFVGTHMRPAK